MLFADTTELKKYLPVNESFAFTNLEDYLQQVEDDVLVPAISQAVYDKMIVGDYNSNHPQLIRHARRVVANLGWLAYSAFSTVQLDDSGIGEKEGSARIDVLENIRIACRDRGNKAMESLLQYLEAYEAAFPDWKSSPSYTVYREFPIRTAQDFQRYYNIQASRQIFLALKPAMRRAVDIHLLPVLGAELYGKILDPASNTVYAQLQQLASPVLAHYAVFFGIDELNVTLDERGVIQFNNTSSGKMRTYLPAQLQAVAALKESMCQLGSSYLQKLLNFLTDNADDIPEYTKPVSAGGRVDLNPCDPVGGFM